MFSSSSMFFKNNWILHFSKLTVYLMKFKKLSQIFPSCTFLDHNIDTLLYSWVDYFCLWLWQNLESTVETTVMILQFYEMNTSWETFHLTPNMDSIPPLTCFWTQQCQLLKLSCLVTIIWNTPRNTMYRKHC